MTKSPSKTQKLKWLRNARVYLAAGHTRFSCIAMNLSNDGNMFGGGGDMFSNAAERWYVTLSARFMGRIGPFLLARDFESVAHRDLWFAMLETLVKAGEDEKNLKNFSTSRRCGDNVAP